MAKMAARDSNSTQQPPHGPPAATRERDAERRRARDARLAADSGCGVSLARSLARNSTAPHSHAGSRHSSRSARGRERRQQAVNGRRGVGWAGLVGGRSSSSSGERTRTTRGWRSALRLLSSLLLLLFWSSCCPIWLPRATFGSLAPPWRPCAAASPLAPLAPLFGRRPRINFIASKGAHI